MVKKKPKFYAVWEGHAPGVYRDWKTCQQQISGFSGAKYKSFGSLEEANNAYAEGPDNYWGKNDGSKKKKAKTPKRTLDELRTMGVELSAIAVDAACKGVPGPMEYQGVEIASGVNLFHQGPFPDGTNNIGEFLALVHALALMKACDQPDRTIYSDSRIAMGWIRQKKCKTKATQTTANVKIFQLIRRAEKWLKENEVSNPVLKWETKKWGEIPADFGRK